MTEHVAILSKKWKLLDKILAGEKTIESRWYTSRRAPWNRIKKGETIYFKNSGEPVTAKATASKVTQTELDKNKVKDILQKHGKEIGIEDKTDFFYQKNKDKKYCMLIHLENPQRIKPFNIDKTGHGLMAAWITEEKIRKIADI